MKPFATLLLSPLKRASRQLTIAGLLGGALIASLPAQAQVAYATGGTGKYKNSIAWLTWGGGTNGTNGALLSPGTTNVTNLTIGGSTLAVTTTISGFTANALKAYRSGSYSGDGLDDAYNIGGTGTSNTLVTGLANAVNAATVNFNVTVSATLDGVAVKIPSVVLADAEVTSNSNEQVAVTADGNWSAVEVYSGCTNGYNAIVSTTSGTNRNLRFSGNECGSSSIGPGGIASLAFNSSAYTGATNSVTISATVKGQGTNALAIGLLLAADYGDAPASTYGYAVHLIPEIFSPQLASGSTTNLNATGYTFASLTNPSLRLGSLVDADNNSYTGSATLNEDDNNLGAGGTNDEDGVTFSAIPVSGLPLTQTVASYSVTTSVYNATGQAANLVGWIDWNNNGTFEASEAATATAPSTGGSANVTLTWTNQTVVGTYGQRSVNSRFRLTTDALTASMPSGGASNGEVEDYIIPFAGPLPVTLVSFTAKAAAGCTVVLNWQTASEANSARYEIQRSADGVTFAPLAAVASLNQTTGASYSSRDNTPLAEQGFYRLRMVDLDGSASYSPVAVVAPACGPTTLTLVPNPASSAVTIGGLHTGQQLRFYAADGHLMHTDRATDKTQHFDLAGWQQGLYLLHVLQADGTPAGSLRLFKE